MPALCSILNSAYYANNYASIFDAGLTTNKYSNTTYVWQQAMKLYILYVIVIVHDTGDNWQEINFLLAYMYFN